MQKITEHLKDATEIAHAHVGEAQVNMKSDSDRFHQAKLRTFLEGDQVLALPLLSKQPLQSPHTCPFRVLQRLRELISVTATPERRSKWRNVNIILLKEYHLRE